MNYTQNGRIAQVTETTLVVGVDVGSTTHYVRAFDWCGNETGKSVCRIENNREGFDKFNKWMKFTAKRTYADRIIVGAEPTGHYWFGLDAYLAENDIKLVMVNPYHVKQSKEMDDNSQTKNDRKDPKVIAKLVTEGRYREPYMPKGIYADLRTATAERQEIMNSLIRLKNQISRWISIYFPEYADVYGNIESESSIMLLKKACIPEDIMRLGAEGINQIWREAKLRAVGIKRATSLYEAAKESIGIS